MTTYQQQFNAYAAIKAQSALGTIASGSGALLIPLTGGTLKASKQAIVSNQVRQDGMSVRGRHGSQSFTADYKGELQNNNYDTLLAALMRTTPTAGVAVTQATGGMASATMSISGSVITFSTGNVITVGIKCNDIISFTVGAAAGDLNKNLRVQSLTATTITVAETLTTVAGPVTTYSFSVRGHKIINPASGALVPTYFTLEEYEMDSDVSTVAQDVKVGKVSLAGQPNGMVTCDLGFVGTGNVQALTGASAPYFTTPALSSTSALPYSVIDATLRLGGTDIIELTSFNLSIDMGLVATAVVGAKYAPDVFSGVMKTALTMSMLRKDLAAFSDFLAETTYSFSALLQITGTAPLTFLSINVPYFTLGGVDPSELKRDGGPRTQTITIPDSLIGVDTRGSGYDATEVSFQYSE